MAHTAPPSWMVRRLCLAQKLDTTAIRSLLATGDFDQLIDALETETLECKSVPYQLQFARQKQELAKDVSGMANANGGYILVGIRTESNPARAEERIEEITPFASDHFPIQQHQDVLKSWIYPA